MLFLCWHVNYDVFFLFSTIQILFIWFVWFSFTLLEFLFVCLPDQKYSILITYIHYWNQQIYWSWDTLFPLVLLKYVTISSAESWKDTETLLLFFETEAGKKLSSCKQPCQRKGKCCFQYVMSKSICERHIIHEKKM